MENSLFFIYGLLCIFIPCLIYQIIVIKKKEKKQIFYHLIWTYIFLLYITLALEVAGIGSIWEIHFPDEIIRMSQINWIPFKADDIMTYILNIVMFLPFGFLLPLIWKQFRSLLKVLGMGLLFSLLIEITQIFNNRMSDINDLLMNVLGTLLGFLLWKIVFIFIKKWDYKGTSLTANEPLIYLILAILGRFFLYNWQLLI